jgi:hypothetical protein
MSLLKKILLLSVFPVFVLVLSGCGAQTQPTAPATNSDQNGSSNTPPATDQPQAQAPTSDNVAAIAAQKQSQLPALPADSKQAIDTEINGINSDINAATSNAPSSADLSNTNLGL